MSASGIIPAFSISSSGIAIDFGALSSSCSEADAISNSPVDIGFLTIGNKGNKDIIPDNISLDTIRACACELDLSLDDLIRDASPDRIPYCAARYFAGMSDAQAMKYIKLCMDADSLREE